MKKNCYCLHLVAVLYVSRHLSHSAKVKLHVDEMESLAYICPSEEERCCDFPPSTIGGDASQIVGLYSGTYFRLFVINTISFYALAD